MDSERSPLATDQLSLPQDDFAESVLTTELEPTAGGGKRAILYPRDRDSDEVATRWLAVPETLLVELESVR